VISIPSRLSWSDRIEKVKPKRFFNASTTRESIIEFTLKWKRKKKEMKNGIHCYLCESWKEDGEGKKLRERELGRGIELMQERQI